MIDAGPLPGACQELKEVCFHFPAPSRAEFDSIVSLHTRLPQLEVISTPACDTSLRPGNLFLLPSFGPARNPPACLPTRVLPVGTTLSLRAIMRITRAELSDCSNKRSPMSVLPGLTCHFCRRAGHLPGRAETDPTSPELISASQLHSLRPTLRRPTRNSASSIQLAALSTRAALVTSSLERPQAQDHQQYPTFRNAPRHRQSLHAQQGEGN